MAQKERNETLSILDVDRYFEPVQAKFRQTTKAHQEILWAIRLLRRTDTRR